MHFGPGALLHLGCFSLLPARDAARALILWAPQSCRLSSGRGRLRCSTGRSLRKASGACAGPAPQRRGGRLLPLSAARAPAPGECSDSRDPRSQVLAGLCGKGGATLVCEGHSPTVTRSACTPSVLLSSPRLERRALGQSPPPRPTQAPGQVRRDLLHRLKACRPLSTAPGQGLPFSPL